MPTTTMMKLPKTESPEEFEKICRDVLCIKYNLEFDLYGGRGENQDGVDIRAEQNGKKTVAQCKNYLKPNSSKSLIESFTKDMKAVADTNKNGVIEKFIAMTSHDRNTTVEDEILAFGKTLGLNTKVLFWDNIEEIICGDIALLRTHYPFFRKCELVTTGSIRKMSSFFVGRESELDSIKKIVESGNGAALVTGIGGMGKTEICRKLFYMYEGEVGGKFRYIGWVEWNGSLQNTFYRSFLKTLDIEKVDESFIATKRDIAKFGSDLLLFIDGANDISPDDQIELASLGCKVVVSSRHGRIDRFEAVHTCAMSEEHCTGIYKHIREKGVRDNTAISAIIEKAGRITIVVELLAKAAKAKKLSDSEMLAELNACGFDLSNINEKIFETKTFNQNMEKLFDISGLNEKERGILKKFSLFPPIPLNHDIAKRWMEQETFDLLDDLVNRSWLEENDEEYSRLT